MSNIQSRILQVVTGAGVCLTLVACGGGASGGALSNSSGAASSAGATVNVAAKDFSYDLTPADVPGGTVTFDVKNVGATVHDFKITGNGVNEKTTYIQAGKDDSFTVDLSPGTYNYLCTVPSHKELGMEGSFTVK